MPLPRHIPAVKSVARTTTCGDCHADMTEEYARSPHAAKVSCGGCHNPHQVSELVEVSGDDLNRQCNKCHSVIKITASHAKWLPQTDIHLESVACVTCHSGAENFIVNLYISRKQDGRVKLVPAGYEELKRLSGSNRVADADRLRITTGTSLLTNCGSSTATRCIMTTASRAC